MATVSVCIVTYNSAGDIASCLEAVKKQSQAISAIVVVDNASSDRSVEMVKAQMTTELPIILIENKINNGFAGGQNQAIAATNTDYVLVLNPDVELHTDYVRELICVMESHHDAGSATGLLVSKDNPAIIDSTGLHMGLNRHATDRGAGQPAEKWLQGGKVFGPSGAAALYSRKMIQSVKLEGEFFDETFFAYKEDVDVAWRAQLLGWSSYYVPSAKAVHARGWKKSGRQSISLFVRQNSYVNQIFMIVKNEQLGWHWFKLLPVLALREIMKLIYILMKERDLLGSIKLIVKHMPEMRRKRKVLQMLLKKWK